MTGGRDRLMRKLEANHVPYSHTSSSIEIARQDEFGFGVDLRTGSKGFTVFFEGWHEEFTSEDEAVSCVTFGLSEACRLAVTYRGQMPVKWTVESRKGDRWSADSETGLLWVPFWLRKRVVYRQNRWLSATTLDTPL